MINASDLKAKTDAVRAKILASLQGREDECVCVILQRCSERADNGFECYKISDADWSVLTDRRMPVWAVEETKTNVKKKLETVGFHIGCDAPLPVKSYTCRNTVYWGQGQHETYG